MPIELQSYSQRYFRFVPLPDSWFCAWGCIIGILLAQGSHFAYLLLSFIGISFIIDTSREKHLTRLFFIGSALLAGFVRYSTVTRSFKTSSTALQHASLSGKAHVLSCEHPQGTFRYKTILMMRLQELKREPVPAQKNLQIYLREHKKFQIGDLIGFKNLTMLHTQQEGYAQYLYKEGIVVSVFADNCVCWLIERPTVCLSRSLDSLRSLASHTLSKKLSYPSNSLFLTVFLGAKDRITQSKYLRKKFNYWGIAHFLARSGLHIAVLISALRWCIHTLCVPYLLSEISMLLLIFLYFLLSWPSISFMRALWGFLLFRCFSYGKRSTRLLHILCLTTIGVLIYNPFQLFFLDFQLSFGLTCALAWFNEMHYQIRRLESLRDAESHTNFL